MFEQSFMIFEIRETVQHFKDGQSFNNLTSIELEPIVKVREAKERIEITGHLVLNGEFLNGDLLKGEGDWKDQFEQSDGIHYGSVFYSGEGTESFQYQIPLTFEIQSEKVADLAQVFVFVEDFDYKTISDNELELVAQIKLTGVHPEPKQEKLVDSANDYTYNEGYSYTDERIDIVDGNSNVQVENNQSSVIENPIYSVLKSDKDSRKELKDSKKELKNLETKPLIKEEEKPKTKKDEKSVKSSEYQLQTEEKAENKAISKLATAINKEEEQPPAPAKKLISSKTSKEMLFSMLQGEEEKKYKLKIYFVKKDDTLETIAEKYGIKISSILQYNNLDSNQLEQGQLLYFPDKRKTKND